MPGYDGFWPHRFLSANGIDNHAPDVADLLVNCQAHQVKTYRLNVDGLIRTLAYSHSRMSASKLAAACLVCTGAWLLPDPATLWAILAYFDVHPLYWATLSRVINSEGMRTTSCAGFLPCRIS
jgi:hypothetical protein